MAPWSGNICCLSDGASDSAVDFRAVVALWCVGTQESIAEVADLCVADLCVADLCVADLCVADLCVADLCVADLCAVELVPVD